MTLVPPSLLREIAEIATSYQDAVERLERLERLETLLDGVAAWTLPIEREDARGADIDDKTDEYAPLPPGWQARKDRDWLADLDRFNDLIDEFRVAFNATEEPNRGRTRRRCSRRARGRSIFAGTTNSRPAALPRPADRYMETGWAVSDQSCLGCADFGRVA